MFCAHNLYMDFTNLFKVHSKTKNKEFIVNTKAATWVCKMSFPPFYLFITHTHTPMHPVLNFFPSDMEREMETRLREKYMLVDKTDPASIAAAQQVSHFCCFYFVLCIGFTIKYFISISNGWWKMNNGT